MKGHALVLSLVILVAGACSGAGPAADNARAYALAGTCDRRLDSAFEAWEQEGFSGSVTILGGDAECAQAYGIADAETGRTNTAETVFSIGSITKSVVAAAIFDLVDEGVLSLDDTVGEHVSGLTGAVNDLVLRDLLLHTSGLVGYHGSDHVAMSRNEALGAISALDIPYEPGVEYSYTNAGYTLLALTIESATEEGYRRYLVEHILRDRDGRPLGGFWDGEPGVRGPRAFGHDTEQIRFHRGEFDGPHWALDGNGGIAMSTLEMAVWTRDLFDGRIISPDAVEQLLATTKVQSGYDELPGWGRIPAAQYGETVISTAGGGGSIGHEMTIGWMPESRRVIVVAENAGSRVTASFVNDVAPALLAGTGVPTPPVVEAADPDMARSIVGVYRLAPGDEILVAEEEQGLLVSANGPRSLAIAFPVPASMAGEVERSERYAREYMTGETAEGRSGIARIEAEEGEIGEIQLLGSTFDGFLVTHFAVELGGKWGFVSTEFDANGGVEAAGVGGPPSAWFTYHGGGTFRPFRPHPDQAMVSLEVVDGGLAIEGPDGTLTTIRDW